MAAISELRGHFVDNSGLKRKGRFDLVFGSDKKKKTTHQPKFQYSSILTQPTQLKINDFFVSRVIYALIWLFDHENPLDVFIEFELIDK